MDNSQRNCPLDSDQRNAAEHAASRLLQNNLRYFIGKPYSLEQARELIQYANKIGMWTITTNILGFPYEKADSIKATIDFAKHSGTDFACFFLLVPQPTSEVYQYFKKEGLLDIDNFLDTGNISSEEFEKINYILNDAGCNTLYFSKEELKKIQKSAYRSFIIHRALTYLFNPLRLIRKVHSREDFFYVLKLLRRGASVFYRTLNPFNIKSGDFFYADTKKQLQE